MQSMAHSTMAIAMVWKCIRLSIVEQHCPCLTNYSLPFVTDADVSADNLLNDKSLNHLDWCRSMNTNVSIAQDCATTLE